LTQLAAASNCGLLPSPSFAFDGVRTPPEELVNSASPELALRFQRSQINQPDLTFPQSPGIILKRTTSILLSAARFVLSMNRRHFSRNFISAHKLICTVYSPKIRGEQAVNKLKTPMKSRLQTILTIELFTGKMPKKSGGEQVAEKIFENFQPAKMIRRVGNARKDFCPRKVAGQRMKIKIATWRVFRVPVFETAIFLN
jgi:hypothetical protein